MAKKREPSIEYEDKSMKFERLAERRVNEVIKKIRLVGNLANRRNYSYSDEQAKQILDALDIELRALKSQFRSDSEAQGPRFSFKNK